MTDEPTPAQDLRSALEPFAALADAILSEAPSGAENTVLFSGCDGKSQTISMDQLRAATAALAQPAENAKAWEVVAFRDFASDEAHRIGVRNAEDDVHPACSRRVGLAIQKAIQALPLQAEVIPTNVYYSAEGGNFYGVFKKGCGNDFHAKWHHRRYDFPQSYEQLISIAHPPAAEPVGLREAEYLIKSIAEVVEEDGGCWSACSGCQESVDGCVSFRDYPYSHIFRCQPGGGCSECGGIGVVWQDGDFLSSYGEALATPARTDDAGRPGWGWSGDAGGGCEGGGKHLLRWGSSVP
ncbi:MAG: hypothetical protein V4523_07770 [Pseudomonadota bacterium]